MQISMFIFFFAIQMILFVIFVQEVFLAEHTEIKTSMEFNEMNEVEFPGIAICSSTFYSKEIIDSNYENLFFNLDASTRKFLLQSTFQCFLFFKCKENSRKTTRSRFPHSYLVDDVAYSKQVGVE